MGLLDKLKGSRPAQEGVAPVTVDEQATVTWRDGIPSISKSWSRGQMNEIQSGQAIGFTEEGELGQVYNYKFCSSEIKDPLRDAVTEHDWGWKALSFKL